MVVEMQMMKEMMDFMMNALKGWGVKQPWWVGPLDGLTLHNTRHFIPLSYKVLYATNRSLWQVKGSLRSPGVIQKPHALTRCGRWDHVPSLPNYVEGSREGVVQQIDASYFIGAHRYKEVTYEWQNPWYPQIEYVEEVWKSSKMSLKWNGLSKGTLPKKMTAWFSCIITEHIRERARDMSIKELGAKRKTSNASSPNETFDLRGD